MLRHHERQFEYILLADANYVRRDQRFGVAGQRERAHRRQPDVYGHSDRIVKYVGKLAGKRSNRRRDRNRHNYSDRPLCSSEQSPDFEYRYRQRRKRCQLRRLGNHFSNAAESGSGGKQRCAGIRPKRQF
jgi:hypothetical protein